MKKILLTLFLRAILTTILTSQNSKYLSGSSGNEQIKAHLIEVNQRHADSTFIYSAIPEKLDLPQVENSGTLHFPYPVIFIHGLTGSADTWNTFYNHVLNQGWSYGEQLKFNLNADDNLYYSNIYSTSESDILDFNTTVEAADFYVVNFNCSISGESFGSDYNTSTQSNQAAIVKQGLAVRQAISHVLEATGRNKVILFGHSMGGLAARQYIQNPDFWQQDGDHHVAKLVTTGTPHGGSNASIGALLDDLLDIDERSDAVRDLRRSYFYSDDDGVFLYGGWEDETVMDDNVLGFYGIDVNCNGDVGNQVEGLNTKPIYIDLDYSCIIGDWLWSVNAGDGVVRIEDAQLKNFYDITSETFTEFSSSIFPLHTQLSGLTKTNFYGFDEPDYYHLSFEIDLNTDYNGFITEQATDAQYTMDYDDFSFSTLETGWVSINVENVVAHPFGIAILDASTLDVLFDQTYPSLTVQTNPVLLPAGNYYLEFYANGEEDSWQYPYGFRIDWVSDQPTAAIDIDEKVKIDIYPNPVSSILNISVESIKEIQSEVRLLNELGQLILTDEIEGSGTFTKQIDTSHLPSGLYFMSIQTKEKVITRRIMKK